jgi:hypothetical protein
MVLTDQMTMIEGRVAMTLGGLILARTGAWREGVDGVNWHLDINCFKNVIKVIGSLYRYLCRDPLISQSRQPRRHKDVYEHA